MISVQGDIVFRDSVRSSFKVYTGVDVTPTSCLGIQVRVQQVDIVESRTEIRDTLFCTLAFLYTLRPTCIFYKCTVHI